ncbi:MAG: CARDB domain-containing protein [Thermoplasmatota archaeon]
MKTEQIALALVALVVASGFAVIVPPARAQASGADLTVLSVVSTDTSGKGPVVNVSKDVYALVKNLGPNPSTSFDLTFYWNHHDSNHYLTEGVGTGGTTAEGQLPAVQSVVHVTNQINVNQVVQVHINQNSWTPAPDQGGLGNILANITSTVLLGNNDPDPTNNERAEPTFVQKPAVKLFREWNVTRDWHDIKTVCPDQGDALQSCLILPGETVRFLAAVDNTGNAPDTFSPSVQGDPNGKLANWNVSFFPTRVAGDSGTNNSMEVLVQPPNYAIAATAASGDAGAINNFSTDSSADTFIQTASDANGKVLSKVPFPKIRVGQVYKLNLTANVTYNKTNVSAPVKFNMKIGNEGNGVDNVQFRFELAKSSVDNSWQPHFTSNNITLQPRNTAGAKQDVTFTVTPPQGTLRGFYPLWVEAFSNKDPSGKAFAEKQFLAYVNQTYALSGGLNTPSQSKAPADPATFRVSITNNGNGPDNLTATLANTPFEWTASLAPTRATIGPGNTTVFLLNVSSPPNTQPNHFADVFVNVTSQDTWHIFKEQKVNLSSKARVTVVRESNFVLTPLNGVGPRFVDAGKSITYSFNVQNLGNEEDTVAFTKQLSNSEWFVNVTPTTLDLIPMASQVITVQITSPANGALGSSARVVLTGTPGDGASPVRQLTYAARISGPDLTVTSLGTDVANVYSGDPVNVQVSVANLGNKEAGRNVTVRIVASQAGTERLIAESSVGNLAGGAQLQLNVSWNTTNVEGPMTLIARVDPQDLVPEIDETNNQASAPTFVRRFAVHVTPALGLTARPGERVDYLAPPNAFVVTNDGNAIEPVVIDLVSQHGWGSAHVEASLRPADSVTVPLTLNVPVLPLTDEDVAELNVVATDRPAHPLTGSLTTTLIDNDPPEVAAFRASPGIVDLGKEVNLTAKLTDAIGVASARVFVFDPANATTDYPLARVGTTDTWYTIHLFTLVGTYRAYLETTDASKNANVNNTRHTPISFLVRATSKPAISLGTNPPTTIRSGTPIPVTITDPLGIGEASYIVSGVEVPLPRPFVIDTTNWTAGTIDLTIDAANVYGVASSAHFTIAVDNTPPKILGYTLDPSKPVAGEPVTLRITTDPNVAQVDVVIRKDGVAIDTRPALSQGTGIFVLKYTPDQGDYTFDLVAKDDAGNTKLAEKAVLFSAKPAGFIPGFDALGACAAVAVALAVARRRRG